MNIYLLSKVSYIKKFRNSMYIYDGDSNYQLPLPLQSLVDYYLDGISNFDVMLQLFIDKHKIQGTVDELKVALQNNSQFRNVFTFDKCDSDLKVFGRYGECFPAELHIELTNACNLKCHHCYKKANQGKISFLDFDTLKNKVFDICAGQTQIMHLTGGEPSLHPDFVKIVDYISGFFHVQLTTNGANIWNTPISTLSKISDIDISMYGIDRESYEENTGNLYAYDSFEKSCNLLSMNNIDFRINMIVNRKNIAKMDEYVQKAIKLGATSFAFGLPTKTGRLIEKPNTEWDTDSDMTKYVYRYMRMASEKYKDRINIVEWGRDVYSHRSNIFENDYALPCKGGTYSWWMNEKMEFRPCAMIPEEYILLSYEDWIDYCKNRFNISWKESYVKFKDYCLEKTINPEDICYVFDGSINQV